MNLILISEILGLFVNTFPADDKYFLHNKKNLPQEISEMHIKFWTF